MIVLDIELDHRILEHTSCVTHNERDVSIMEYSTHHEQYKFTVQYALHGPLRTRKPLNMGVANFNYGVGGPRLARGEHRGVPVLDSCVENLLVLH